MDFRWSVERLAANNICLRWVALPLPVWMAQNKTCFRGLAPNEDLLLEVPDLVALNVDDVVSIARQYHIIHHKYYDTEAGRMVYVVGPPSKLHPRAGDVSVGWSEEIQPS